MLPAASLMIISATSVILGVCFANWPYDYHTLWNTTCGQECFDNALQHYKVLATQPKLTLYSLAVVMGIAMLGSFIKIYKPSEDTKYFEYGTLLTLVVAVSIYITNIRAGEASAVYGKWGDVDQNTGLGVIAASIVMIVVLLLGVIVLQCGLFFAEYQDYKVKTDFYLRELGTKFNEMQDEKNKNKDTKPTKASGVSKSATSVKSRKA